MACMFWHEVAARWKTIRDGGEAVVPALQQAIDATFEARIGDISGRGKLAADMREIWLMQPRFEKRTGTAPMAMLKQPRFRAAFDFLRLRADAGEGDRELVEWWQDFSNGDEAQQQALVDGLRHATQSRRTEKAAVRASKTEARGARAGGAGGGAGGGGGKQELLQELAVRTRTALSPGATEEDRAVVREMFDKLGMRPGAMAASPDATPKQAMLIELTELTHIALAPGATESDRATVRGMLDKLEKKSGRRRRGGRRKEGVESTAGKRGDDDEEPGPDFIGF
jgi:hypothetical protein